jgi:hypothetical protein
MAIPALAFHKAFPFVTFPSMLTLLSKAFMASIQEY